MMSDHGLPRDIKLRVRDFFRRSKHLMQRQTHDALIERCLSTALTADVRFLISKVSFPPKGW